MNYRTVADINEYHGQSINPMDFPEEMFELYSVPSFDANYPEIVMGRDIGSTKVTVQEGDVLICKINPRINRVWVVKRHTEYLLIASSEWIVARNDAIDSDYLRWYFSSPYFRMLLNSEVAGIGGSLTRAQPKQVARYHVPVPDIKKQHYVSALLDKISNLISLHRQQVVSLDELVKSQFIGMFGATPPSEFTSMSDVCLIITDGTHQPPKFVSEGIPFIFVSNITSNEVTYNAEKYISEETYRELIQRTPVTIGDILLSTVGSYGHPAIVKSKRKFCFQRHIAYLKPNPKSVDSIYLHAAIMSEIVQNQIDTAVKGIAQKNVGKTTLPSISAAPEISGNFASPAPLSIPRQTYIVPSGI